MIEPQVAGLVVLPYVHRWRDLADPLSDAARLATDTVEELPRPLRGYARALAELAQQVMGSGLLNRPTAATPTLASSGPASGPISEPLPVAAPDVSGEHFLDTPLSRVAAYGGAR
jgi:hypothetical protein